MVEVRGKFITLAAGFIKIYPRYYDKADAFVLEKTGLRQTQLDPEAWYDARIYAYLMECFVEASPTKEKALITLGRGIYPTIQRTVGLPPGLETIEDFVEFEAKAYLDNVRGPGVRPRRISKLADGHLRIQLRMDEQPCKIGEGVYQGMLTMTGNPDGIVEHRRCIRNGDPECEFHILTGDSVPSS